MAKKKKKPLFEEAVPPDFVPRLLKLLPDDAPYHDPENIALILWDMLEGGITHIFLLRELSFYLQKNPDLVVAYEMDDVEKKELRGFQRWQEKLRLKSLDETTDPRAREFFSDMTGPEVDYYPSVGSGAFGRKMDLIRTSDGPRIVTRWPLIWPFPPLPPFKPERIRTALENRCIDQRARDMFEQHLARQTAAGGETAI